MSSDPNNTWNGEQFRLTVFTQSGTPIPRDKYERIWESLALGIADNTNHKKTGVSSYQKQWSGCGIVLQIQKNRIDLIAREDESARASEEDDIPIDETEGYLNRNEKPFNELCLKLLSGAPLSYVNRLAIGKIAKIAHTSQSEVNKFLAARLRDQVRINPDNLSDFLFRYNEVQPSTAVKGLDINRLREWASHKQITVRVDVLGTQSQKPLNEVFVEQLQFDINTVPLEDTLIEREACLLLYKEMVDVGNKIFLEAVTHE